MVASAQSRPRVFNPSGTPHTLPGFHDKALTDHAAGVTVERL